MQLFEVTNPAGWAHMRGSRHYLGLVMRVLASAVRCGLPLAPAFRALAEDPRLPGSKPRGRRWRERLKLVAGDVEDGHPLSDALERHASAMLPSHFLPALRCAEQSGTVERTFPVLADNLSASLASASRCRTAFAYPITQLIPICMVAAGLCVFILPKLARIFQEMGRAGLPPPMAFLMRLWTWLPSFMIACLMVVVALAVLHLSLPALRRIPWCCDAVERFAFSVPIFGRLSRLNATLGTTQALAGYTSAGADMLTAADGAMAGVASPWARRRLEVFAESVRAGIPWVDAWCATGFGTPLHDWMIRNAAALERPAEGFQWMTDSLNEEVARLGRRVTRWVEPCGIIFNSAIVGLIVFSTASTLFSIIIHAAD